MASASDFSGLVDNIISPGTGIIILIVALSLVVFLYGLVTYLVNSNNEDKRSESISYITAGLIGLFVMVSVWSLVILLANTFGISADDVKVPQVTY